MGDLSVPYQPHPPTLTWILMDISTIVQLFRRICLNTTFSNWATNNSYTCITALSCLWLILSSRVSFRQRYVPKNKYKEVIMFNPKEGLRVLLCDSHWRAPYPLFCNGLVLITVCVSRWYLKHGRQKGRDGCLVWVILSDHWEPVRVLHLPPLLRHNKFVPNWNEVSTTTGYCTAT